jgi:hypothetical protein
MVTARGLTAARWLSTHKINHRGPRRGTDELFATDVAQIAIKENGVRKANTFDVIATNENDVAFSIASFSGTPVETIRTVIAESTAILTPSRNLPVGRAALC